ncbi:hypothetical protein GBAR_LOCUS21581, partial [Geodia barretti]
ARTNISLSRTNLQIAIVDNETAPVIVELEKTGYTASESHPLIIICAVITDNSSDCAVEFQFEVMLTVNATTEDFSETQLPLVFAACEAIACAEVEVEDDSIAETDESFSVMLERSDSLDSRIELSASIANLTIEGDDDAMVVGFNSTTYTGTETAGHARVCVEVSNPSSGGAVRPFSITMF